MSNTTTLVLGMALWPLPRGTVGTGAVYTTVAVVAAAAFTGHTAPTREPIRTVVLLSLRLLLGAIASLR